MQQGSLLQMESLMHQVCTWNSLKMLAVYLVTSFKYAATAWADLNLQTHAHITHNEISGASISKCTL